MTVFHNTTKRNLMLLCGGCSVEHDVSLNSARFIAEQINPMEYNVLVVIVGHDHEWVSVPYGRFMRGERTGLPVYLRRYQGSAWLMGDNFSEPVHMVFPAIHGTGGEDGSIQGLLDYMKLPYVGNGVFASSATMDKIATKEILLANHLPCLPFLSASHAGSIPTYAQACRTLSSETLVIKPAQSGSSVGVSKIDNECDYEEKINTAFSYSHRILIEPAITGSEVECAILGNEDAFASGVGEIIVHRADKMYSYGAKYHDPEEKQATVHAKAITIDIETQNRVRTMALRAFHAMTCSGLARIDFFVTTDGIFINELNTMPGFTAISLYPQLWQHSGISPKELISRLLQCAQDRFDQNIRLNHRYEEVQTTSETLRHSL